MNFKLSKTIIYAPLAGISDSPSRTIAVRFGADVTISELISSEGIIRNCKKTLELAKFNDSERPIGLQIFGANPDSMAQAARILASLKPDFIDINFGCPARKVVGKNGGSSVLRDLGLMDRIVSSVVKAIDIPVTVKMRSGWDHNSLKYIEAGKIIEGCGASAITLHPRTKIQEFSGRAHWSHIAELKRTVDIPVIGNGDITMPDDALRMFQQTGCDGVMIGRGSIGNPWIFRRIKEYLRTGSIPPEPTPREIIEQAIEHLGMTIDSFGLPSAVYRMRSRFCWYLKGLPGSSAIRAKINRLESPAMIRDLLYSYLEDIESKSKRCEARIFAGNCD